MNSVPTKLYQCHPVDLQVSKMLAHMVDDDKVEKLRNNLDSRRALISLHDTPGSLNMENTMT